MHYYDLVLLVIASSMGFGVIVGMATPISLQYAVPLLGLVAIVAIGHALFVNGPVDDLADLTDEVEPTVVPVVANAVMDES